MSDQLITVGFGKESFSAETVSLSAFDVRNGFERVIPSKRYKRQGSVQRFPASAHPEVNGYLFLDTVIVPEGTVIVVQASTKRRGASIRDGAIFIQIRSTGAMQVIKAQLPTALEATQTGTFLVFQGRGDILKLADLEALGVEPPKHWINAFMDEEEVRETYEVVEIAPATAERAKFTTVTTESGEQVAVPSRAGRRIRIR